MFSNDFLRLSAIGLLGFALQSSALADTAQKISACESAMGNAHTSNARELWQGASDCGEAGDLDRTTFLLLAGQIRAMTDMATLKAATDEDKIKVGDLYGVFFYQTGGSGDDEIYRSTERSNKLFKELRKWSPELGETYDPGWAYKSNVDIAEYGQMVACQKAVRIAKLNWYASLVRNDDYYSASTELNALRAANPGPVTSGSDLDKQMSAIMSRMNNATAGSSLPTTPPKECDFAREFKPDPDADFTQLYVGANGPSGSGVSAFESKDSVTESWIANALSPAELDDVLDRVNFDNQILVALNFGKRQNATGTIYISNVSYNSVLESLSVSGLIGVNEPLCEEPYTDSYPFVLAVAPRPEKVPTFPGMFQQNFPDGCKPTMIGSPVTDHN